MSESVQKHLEFAIEGVRNCYFDVHRGLNAGKVELTVVQMLRLR